MQHRESHRNSFDQVSLSEAMGRAAGARSLGVDWGYHDADALWAAGAFHVATHPHHIIEAVE